MSGYRTLHRIQPPPPPPSLTSSPLESSSSPPILPLWRVRFSPCLPTSSSSSASSELGHRRLSSSSSSSRLLVAGASNLIQCYTLTDRTTNDSTSISSADDVILNASALTVACTECFVSGDDYNSAVATPLAATSTTTITNTTTTTSLGYAALDIVRNYCGEDDIAGDEIVMASKLGGQVCIWVRRRDAKNEKVQQVEDNDDVSTLFDVDNKIGNNGCGGKYNDEITTQYIRPNIEFEVRSATGTTLAIRPPSLANYYNGNDDDDDDDILVALGCADGAVVLCQTSVLSARPGGRKQLDGGDGTTVILSKTTPGKIIASVGSGHACVLSLRFHPTCPNSFVVGRKDGTVDIYSSPLSTTTKALNFRRMHHLLHASSPVRALSFSCPDGALLFAGDDDGHIYSYDVSCNNEQTNMSAPVMLVACATTAHKGWVMDVTSFPDGRRLASCGSDRSAKVWDCGSGLASSKPVHSFEGVHDGLVWGVDCSRADVRPGGTFGARSSGSTKLASCGNDGVVQIFSCGE